MSTINDSKSALEQALPAVLRAHLPQTTGYALEIDILENDRKKRSPAARESWRPANGEIRIRFGGPASAILGTVTSSQVIHQEEKEAASVPPDAQEQVAIPYRAELIRSLWDAEQRPGFEFVALKWFRDLFLPAQGYQWSRNSAERDRVIRTAVDDGVLLTYKVPNPKNPGFPVTAIRLSRQHPDVSATLRDEGAGASGFTPVDIRGEPLSTTVLHERR